MKQISLKTTGGYLTVIAAHITEYKVNGKEVTIETTTDRHTLNFQDEKIALTNYIMLQEYLAKPLTKEQLTFTFNFLTTKILTNEKHSS